MGIRMRSILVMGILGLVTIAIIGATSYRMSVNNALDEARIKSNIILNYAMATKAYMKEVQKPLVKELIEADRFYPELMSGFVSARGTFEFFQKEYPGYIFKQATIDPLNPYNKADQREQEIIAQFRQDPSLKKLEGQIEKDGQDVFYFSQPVSVEKKGCLTCHGDPADAPKDQIEIYGDENGYNWKMKDTVAAFMIYIPTAEAMSSALRFSIILMISSALGIFLMLLAIWIFLDNVVVLPIVKLAERTESFSLGENLDEPIIGRSKDEIGELSHSIERLRISLSKLLKKRS